MKQEREFNLELKAEQILCLKHKLPIVSLNIDPNIKSGQKLYCKGCSTFGQSFVFVSKAEDYLLNFKKSENQEIEQIQNYFLSWAQQLKSSIDQIFKQFSNLIEFIQSRSDLNKLLNLLQDKTAGASIFTQIATYLSHQRIINGKLEQTHPFELPFKVKQAMEESMERISSEINYLSSTLKCNISQIGIDSLSQVQLNETCLNYENPQILEGHLDWIKILTISNDDKLLASGGIDGKIILWELFSKSIIQEYNRGFQIQDLIFSFNNQLLAAALFNQIQIFDVTNIKQSNSLITLSGHGDIVWSMSFTNDSKFLISGSRDRTLKIWNLNEQKCIANKELADQIYGVSISQNEKFISVCCQQGYVNLFYCPQRWEFKAQVKWIADVSINCTLFTPDSKNVLTCYEEIKFWKVDELLSNNEQKIPVKIIEGNNNKWISTSLRNSILISFKEEIKILNIHSKQLIKVGMIPKQKINNNQSVAVTQNMKYIIICESNDKLVIYELNQK